MIVKGYFSTRFLNARQMILQQEDQCIHDSKERVVGPNPTLISFVREISIALRAFLAELNCTARSSIVVYVKVQFFRCWPIS